MSKRKEMSGMSNATVQRHRETARTARQLPGPKVAEGKESSEFGNELRRMRLAANHTQATLAACAGVSAGYIGLIETGDRGSRPSLDIVKRLAQCCKATLEQTETLLRITGHLLPHETLLHDARPTTLQIIYVDPQLTKDQKETLAFIYRSWVGSQ